MAIRLIVNVSKKVPIAGLDYSSVQASCSIEGEIAANQDAAAESARLFGQAEAAVDRQLGIGAATAKPTSPPAQNASAQSPPQHAPTSSNARPSAIGPVRRLRGPAPVTDAQLRLLQKLIAEGRASLDAILAHHGVGDLRDITCKAASVVIDELKARTPRS